MVIFLKHFRLNLFKFRNFFNTLRNFAKSVFAHMFSKVIIYSKSPDHVLQNDIYNIFIFYISLKFFLNSRSGAIAEPFRENCS